MPEQFSPDEQSLHEQNPETSSDETINGNEASVDLAVDAVQATPETRRFEDLTLAELFRRFVRHPQETWRAFSQITHSQSTTHTENTDEALEVVIAAARPRVAAVNTEQITPSPQWIDRAWFTQNRRRLQLGLYAIAFLVAFVGSHILAFTPGRFESNSLVHGAPLLLLGFLIWLVAEGVGHWEALTNWWERKPPSERWHFFFRVFPIAIILNGIIIFVDSFDSAASEVLLLVRTGTISILIGVFLWVLVEITAWMLKRRNGKPKSDSDIPVSNADGLSTPWFVQLHPLRVAFFIIAIFLSLITWLGTTNNHMSPIVFLMWVGSAVVWSLVFAPMGWRPQDSWAEWKAWVVQFQWQRHGWILVAMLAIMLLGAFFRLDDLEGVPPEMTSDHVEKLLDAQRVKEGQYNIFFANNGGREPFQMYAMALFSNLPGQSINFTSLKLLAVIESLVSLPLFFWLGREIFGERHRKLGTGVGLIMMALVAVSYWHVSITRLALRIIMTPLVTTFLLIYLSRAMRLNRRADFIKVGLILGFGLYTYQAVRMLPIVIVVGVALAVMLKAKSWRDVARYSLNLAVLVWIAFMVFLPLFHYSVENPEHFWLRTTGRLLGDDVITETLEDGNIVQRDATLQERLEAFNENLPVLMSNVRNVLLMYNWKGDVAWINGAPNAPAMDTFAGTLFILGLATWLVLMIRKRDPVYWLMPIMLLIMLMPSALSIAYPIENPSATRTSGSLPEAYLLAALPLSLFVLKFVDSRPRGWRGFVALGVISVVILGGYIQNSTLYFGRFVKAYKSASLPYSEGGQILQGFALSDGTYGNAFMIAYQYWWDHRALGLEANLVDYPNGVVKLSDLPTMMSANVTRTDRYRFDPMKDILFIYSIDDEETSLQLQEWFPEGRETVVDSYQENDDFKLYRVPWIGHDGFEDFLRSALPEN